MAEVPLFATSLAPYNGRLAEAIARVIATRQFILGPEVDAFEREFAAYLGVKHCVGVGNGTDALTISLRALGIRPGDEVVMPSFTFYATAEAAINAGAKPVFCDIDLDTFCVTAETVRRALTARTKAILPVHLFGNVAPVPELRELGLPVLEDAAQAAGAALGGVKAGALGDAATFSFFPSKNLPALGDGGAITTNEDEVAETARTLRFHGSKDKVTFVDVGYNSRLDSVQAAALRVLLPELDGWNARRREVAAAYERLGLGDHAALPRATDGAEHVYHLYVVRGESLPLGRSYYRVPVHRQPAIASDVELPATEEAARTNVALPMGPELTEEQIRRVVQACASGST
ncbi:MAG TPA: DegT/DnrJ/EryC1/StrS family aminotransferase [Thermoleophilaceae bacterium]|jgi:dTDP-4-amino-4,6-dideoxygalactose transaminase|nr:DegT/DnrJ/EryC1/StrS family aminotransferase [Thermoleophilaceae bacterium]